MLQVTVHFGTSTADDCCYLSISSLVYCIKRILCSNQMRIEGLEQRLAVLQSLFRKTQPTAVAV